MSRRHPRSSTSIASADRISARQAVLEHLALQYGVARCTMSTTGAPCPLRLRLPKALGRRFGCSPRGDRADVPVVQAKERSVAELTDLENDLDGVTGLAP